jgi:hypothetical protein
MRDKNGQLLKVGDRVSFIGFFAEKVGTISSMFYWKRTGEAVIANIITDDMRPGDLVWGRSGHQLIKVTHNYIPQRKTSSIIFLIYFLILVFLISMIFLVIASAPH